MIVLLLLALFLPGDAASSSILPQDLESSDFDMMVESMTNGTAEFRQGPPPLPPFCPSAAQPNVKSVVSVSGHCTYTLRHGRQREGGKIQAALNISAPHGTKECTLKITSDGPGTTAFIVREFPEDARMRLTQKIGGAIRSFKKSGNVMVGIGRTCTTFKYSSPSGGAIFINVFAVCYRGCHGKVTVGEGDTAVISYPPKEGRVKIPVGRRETEVCEYWFTALSGRKVVLDFNQFNFKWSCGRWRCRGFKALFAKSGDKFFENDVQSEYGQEKDDLQVNSTTSEIYFAFQAGTGDSSPSFSLEYSAV